MEKTLRLESLKRGIRWKGGQISVRVEELRQQDKECPNTKAGL